MGALLTKIRVPIGNVAGSVTEIISGRKRKRSDDDYEASDEANIFLERSLNTPKKKKLVSTAQYIYQALFKEERNSDIAVMALGNLI
jgi:BTB/POZ domain-containing protein 13 (germ cell-less protein-like 1)